MCRLVSMSGQAASCSAVAWGVCTGRELTVAVSDAISVLVATHTGRRVTVEHTAASSHVDRTRHTGIEAANGAQDVNPRKILRARKLLQQGRVQHRLFIRPRRAKRVLWRCHPG